MAGYIYNLFKQYWPTPSTSASGRDIEKESELNFLHNELKVKILDHLYPELPNYESILTRARAYLPPVDIAKCKSNVAELLNALELKGKFDIGDYEVLRQIVGGLNEPVVKIIDEYQRRLQNVLDDPADKGTTSTMQEETENTNIKDPDTLNENLAETLYLMTEDSEMEFKEDDPADRGTTSTMQEETENINIKEPDTLNENLAETLNLLTEETESKAAHSEDSPVTPIQDETRKRHLLIDLPNENKKIKHGDPESHTKQTEMESEEVTAMDIDVDVKVKASTRVDDFKKLLVCLDLEKYYPGQLSLQDAIAITDENDCKELKDVAWFMLRKLIMIDYRSRDTLLSVFLKKKPIKKLNPLDIFLLLFCCCDNNLQQILINKLCICSLAFPFIYCITNEDVLHFPLWAIRGSNIEWACNEAYNSQPSLVELPLKIISFLRYNSISHSKSKFLNEVLYDDYHNAFFNSECHLGKTERVLTNGLIEASWFLPSEDSEIFSELLLFLNLRGNAYIHVPQMQLMTNSSCICVVFTDITEANSRPFTEKVRDMLDKEVSVVTVVCCPSEAEEDKIKSYENEVKSLSKKKFVSILHKTDTTLFDTKTEIRACIRDFLKHAKHSSLSEFCTKNNEYEIKCDEDSLTCKKGKQLAEKVISKIRRTPIERIKEKHATSQWTLWMEYTNLLKQQYKMGETIGKKDDLLRRTDEVLKKLAKLGEKPTPFVKEFIKVVLCSSHDDRTLSYFIRWLKCFLDDISRSKLPGLKKNNNEAWESVKKAEECNVQQSELKIIKNNALEAERRLSDASFGFEHIVRELGHIYESVNACPDSVSPNTLAQINKLPEIIAKFLTLGYSFELMDGDTASIPLEWVSAVMQNTAKIIGDVNILTLSVLGVQSSGKSTLLNSMFGLEFSVSAGRCTRGIFMQLIPVKAHHIKQIDYVLVLDSEGLRAPELAEQKYNHDNELATFIIGLGDITIVNVKGENTAEVEDVLQIVVHAFLRLQNANSSLNLRKRCMFIHQNMKSVRPSDKLMHNKQMLVNLLNRMTQEAAAQENNAEITSFNQVISFDYNEHILYFSDLWKGDPPMAPANTGYSEMSDKAKKCIFQRIVPLQRQFLNITNMIIHIKDLWNGIMGENFVFPFRNSLEVKAYNTMEATYMKLLWDLERYVSTWLQRKITESRKFKKKKDLQKFIEETSSESRSRTLKKKDEIRAEIEQFFETHELRDISLKWKESTLLEIDTKANSFLQNSNREILQIEAQQKVYLETKSTQSSHQMEINKKAEELAFNFRGEIPNTEELRRIFDSMWEKWVKQFEEIPSRQKSIEKEVEEAIYFNLQKESSCLRNMLQQMPLRLKPRNQSLCGSIKTSHIERDKNYISIKKYLFVTNKDSFDKCRESAVAIINTILAMIDVHLKKLSKTDTKFHHAFITEIHAIITNELARYNSSESRLNFTFTPACTVFLILHTFRFCLPIFEKLDISYEKKHGANAKLESYKDTAWNLFLNILHKKSDEVIVADMFCASLKELICENVSRQIPPKIVHKVINEKFACSKQHLILEVLDDLARAEVFENFKLYISDAYEFTYSWIINYTNTFLFDKNPESKTLYAQLADIPMNDMIQEINESVHNASENAMNDPKSAIRDWILYFESSLKGLVIPAKSMDHIYVGNISDFESFRKRVIEKMDSIQRDLRSKFENATIEDIKWENPTPYQQIMDKLWGCKAQCPFCHEPCTKTEDNHFKRSKEAHTCTQHRPGGVIGTEWLKTRKLSVESCNYNIQMKDWLFSCGSCSNMCKKSKICEVLDNEPTHPYISYKNFLPEWDIAPSPNMESSTYWMWFMAKFEDELKKLYGTEETDVPESWRSIKRKKALGSLRKYFG